MSLCLTTAQCTAKAEPTKSQTFSNVRTFNRAESVDACRVKANQIAMRLEFKPDTASTKDLAARDGINALMIICQEPLIVAAGPNNDEIIGIVTKVLTELEKP
jgi:hypothetical protein